MTPKLPNSSATTTQTLEVVPAPGDQAPKKQKEYKWDIVWVNVLAFIYLHLGALYGLYLTIFHAKLLTTLWMLLYGLCVSLGITAGAHRLWSHRSYKAKWPLRLFLAICQTASFQNSIYEWARDHRLHHKYSDTDADPHNASRGFFFSHIGWLLVRKHPDIRTKGKTLDMSDLEKDPIVVWQGRVYFVAMPLLCFVLPTWVPIKMWGEDFWTSWYVAAILRYTLTLNTTWLVNSAAHIWGNRPYEKAIKPAENLFVGIAALGEGWHNYHHVFPWDYKTAELGGSTKNITAIFIEHCAKLGIAYDLKTVPSGLVSKRAQRTGDGTHVWGWGDEDMAPEDIKGAAVINKSL